MSGPSYAVNILSEIRVSTQIFLLNIKNFSFKLQYVSFQKNITAKSEGQPIILALSDIEQGFLSIFFVTSIAKILKETPILNIDSAVHITCS